MLVRGGSRVTRAAQLMWGQFVKPGDFVVDATCGNGGDTLWLSRAVGPTGRVLALDVQVCCHCFWSNFLREVVKVLRSAGVIPPLSFLGGSRDCSPVILREMSAPSSV